MMVVIKQVTYKGRNKMSQCILLYFVRNGFSAEGEVFTSRILPIPPLVGSFLLNEIPIVSKHYNKTQFSAEVIYLYLYLT